MRSRPDASAGVRPGVGSRPRPVAPLRRFAAGVAALAARGVALAPAAAAEPAFTLADARAPLGLATDHGRERYWVLSSSSGLLRLHAFGADGAAQGSMNSRDSVTNAQALAWVDEQAWVGDIGGRRSEVSVWLVPAPWPGTEINHAPRYRLAYPDGAHTASALLVDANQHVFVVTSGDEPGIYRAPDGMGTDSVNELTWVADAPDGVTDGVVLIDGRIVVRTATTVYTLDPTSYEVLGEAEIGEDQRGQSITQGLDQSTVLTAAGTGGEVTAVTVPGVAPARPTATTTRPPTTRRPVEAADPADTRTFEQTGTTVAFVAGVALAVLAAAVVLVRR